MRVKSASVAIISVVVVVVLLILLRSVDPLHQGAHNITDLARPEPVFERADGVPGSFLRVDRRNEHPSDNEDDAREGAEALVQRIERDIEEEGRNLDTLHRSIAKLKEVHSKESAALLRRIGLGQVMVVNPSFQGSAARNLIELDRTEGWQLLKSSNASVRCAALTAVDGLPITEPELALLRECLHDEVAPVRWIAAKVIAQAPPATLAVESAKAIAQAIADVADLPNPGDFEKYTFGVDTEHTVAEINYKRLLVPLISVRVSDSVLHEIAAGVHGRARDAVVLALGERGDSSVHESIIRILQDPEAGLFRAWAARALGQIGHAEDLRFLEGIAHTDPLVRNAPNAFRLPVTADSDRNYPVHKAAQGAIRMIERRVGSL